MSGCRLLFALSDFMANQIKNKGQLDPSAESYLGGGPRVVVSTAAFHARDRGSAPGHGSLKETKMFLPHPRVKFSIVGSLRDREVACSASDRQGSNFESCVWRTVSSKSSHQPQEVLLAQFSLYVHKGGLKPDSFHFIRKLVIVRPSSLYSQFLFNGGTESQPIAGSMPVNCVRRWLNTTPTLTECMILIHQRLQQSLDG